LRPPRVSLLDISVSNGPQMVLVLEHGSAVLMH